MRAKQTIYELMEARASLVVPTRCDELHKLRKDRSGGRAHQWIGYRWEVRAGGYVVRVGYFRDTENEARAALGWG